MNYILDCSFCAAVFLPDEKSENITKIFEGLKEDDTIIVPQLWWYEISSVLSVAVKNERLKHSDVINIIRLLKDYGFDTDVSYGDKYSEKIFELSQLYDLSVYDSAYLELAIRKNGMVGTLDKKLKLACGKSGIGTLVK